VSLVVSCRVLSGWDDVPRGSDLRQLPEEVRGYVLENAEVTRYTLHLGYPHLSLGTRTTPPPHPIL
jgi:hypothetical protein